MCACADIKDGTFWCIWSSTRSITLPQTWPVSCKIMTYGPAFHWTRSSCPIRWRHEPFTQQVSTAPNPSCLSLQHSKFWICFFIRKINKNHLHLVDSDFWIFLVEFPLSHMTLHGPPRLRRFDAFRELFRRRVRLIAVDQVDQSCPAPRFQRRGGTAS